MRTILRIQMTSDIREAFSAAILSLVNVKSEKARFVFRETENLCFYKNPVIFLKEQYFSPKIRIKDFDFSYQPTINKDQVMDFMSLRFIESKTNIIFIGSSGVGKTHLATTIGIEAASKRISTYFINFAVLMEKFKQAAKENRVEKVVKHYLKYTVLIIDEIGYLPVDKDAAFGFFQLIAARYEFRPTILTTNQPFSKWPDVFGDAVIANAIIDRLVHHCDIVKITGHSYRIKGRNIFDDSDD